MIYGKEMDRERVRSIMRIRLSKFFVFITILFIGYVAQAANLVLETIDLEFRTGKEVEQSVRDILSEHSVVTANRNTLILRATPADILAVRKLLETIDMPPRQYVISVATKEQMQASRSSYQVSGSIPVTKGKTIFFNKPGYIDTPKSGGVQGNIIEKKAITTNGVSKRVRVLEGKRVFVSVANGSDGKRIVRKIPGNRQDAEIVTVSDLNGSGFYATVNPRNHDRVVIDISSYLFRRSVASGSSSGEVGTSMYMKLGKWKKINNIQADNSENSSGLLSSNSSAKSQAQELWVRVDQVK